MKDIDFDELDRAVSSVLGQGAVKDEPTPAASTEPVVNEPQDSSQAASSANDSDQTDVTPEAPSPAKPGATPSLAIKRRGKFMDVMHPSADMAPSSQSPQPVRPLTPVAPIAPLVSEKTDTAAPEQSADPAGGLEANPHEPTASLDETTVPIGAEPAPIEALLPDHVPDTESNDTDTDVNADVQTPAEPASSENDTEVDKPVSMYVDPLAAQDETKEATEHEEELSDTDSGFEENVGSADPLPAPSTAVSPELSSQESSTPFLSDTNVDKRPLGAFVGQEQSATPAEPSVTEPLQPAMAMPGDTQSAPAVPLPRELQPDVVEVESVQEPEATAKTAVPDDGRVEGHPLFDTSTYHEPIAAVHGHGMATWLKWMIGLLLCLVVGAGVGYFLFAAGL